MMSVSVINVSCVCVFRMTLQEHHEQRARDACNLITDLLTTPINLPTKPQERHPQRSAPTNLTY